MFVVCSCVFNLAVLGTAHLSRFIVVLYLNCLCANLAYVLQELNETYLLLLTKIFACKNMLSSLILTQC